MVFSVSGDGFILGMVLSVSIYTNMYIHTVVNNEERIVGVFIRNVQECLTRYNYWRVYRVYRVYILARHDNIVARAPNY